jgi:hypothetical protein
VIALVANPADTAWFACVGLPMTAKEFRAAHAYLDALGCDGTVPVSAAGTWKRAAALIKDPSWESSWWDREEQERSQLLARAESQLGRAVVMERLTAATELASQAIHCAAVTAAERARVDDAGLVRAASGAATMALHAAALARLAGADPQHLFVRKYQLFVSGRWPLGIVGGAFHLF